MSDVMNKYDIKVLVNDLDENILTHVLKRYGYNSSYI